ncbi:hypothetical protein JXQ31_11300 [candidate division KSB1 bacterium]|nr:hypothetical protein [candidate division KSB1 bacterium]
MKFSDRANSWFTLFANAGILVGLVLVAIELNQNTNQLRLQLTFQANQKIFENNRELIGSNPTQTIAKAITNPGNLTYDEYLIASSYVLNMLNEWEDRYFISEAGLISENDWKRHINENISWTLGNRFAQKTWQITKYCFEIEFAQYVDQALVKIDDNSTYNEWLQLGFSSNDKK